MSTVQDRQPDLITSQAVDALAHDIAIAKVWSITEYLSFYGSGVLPHTTKIKGLIKRFPEWLDHVILGKS